MLAAITDRTRLIFVCNPNNPTSTVVDPDALARFVEAVPSDILIALDEAYVEYIRDGHAARQLRFGPRSTAMSLCCGRFRRPTGWRVCASVTRSAIRTSSPHWARSTCRSARRASRRPRPSRRWTPPTNCWRRTDAVVAERARVSAALRDAGYAVPPSQANFVWLPLPGAPRVRERLGQQPRHRPALRRGRRRASPSPPRTRTTRSWSSPGWMRWTVLVGDSRPWFKIDAGRSAAAGVGDQPVQRARARRAHRPGRRSPRWSDPAV